VHVELNPVRIYQKYKRRFRSAKLKRLSDGYRFDQHKRFYHFHTRKTAGTSITKVFLACNENDSDELYKRLASQPDQPLLHDDLIFVGWNQQLVEAGDYFFGFSHLPFEDIQLAPQTYRFTVLRDPADRVLSHYRMLMDYSKLENPHPSFADEKPWLGNSFSDFLARVPRQHLQNQLYMFSSDYDVDIAVERVVGLEQVIFFDQLDTGLKKLSAAVGQQLVLRHDRKGKTLLELPDSDVERLKELLADEYDFYNRIRNHLLG